jgi:hypothetical protein
VTRVKASIRPLDDRLQQEMPLARRQESQALQAMDNILNGPDVLPATVADSNLGAVKSILRDKNVNANTRRLAGEIVDTFDPLVDEAVKAGGGMRAYDALQEGRRLTKAKYATERTIKQLPTEPVKLFNKLTAQRDANINLLRDVAAQAPEGMPALGRGALEGLFDQARGPKGNIRPEVARAVWRKMGPETKKLLFQPDQIKRLDAFFG